MKIHNCQQRSQEWYQLKKGRIGGTRFGSVISGKKNRLIYELLDERLNEFNFPDDYVTDEMQFGIDNEPIARELYSKQSGIKFREVGLIESNLSEIHISSPDGLSEDNSIALEIKCTENGYIHIQRFFEGVESNYLGQIKNYFVVSDEIKEVHFVSYCPSRFERPIVVIIFKREDFIKDIENGIKLIAEIELKLNKLQNEFIF